MPISRPPIRGSQSDGELLGLSSRCDSLDKVSRRNVRLAKCSMEKLRQILRRYARDLVTLVLFACVHAALADTVFLRDGRTLEGKIVEQRADEIVFQIGATQITLPRNKIQSIKISFPTQTPEPKPAPKRPARYTQPGKSRIVLEPAQFNGLFHKLPEIKDGQTPEATIRMYRNLVAGLPSDAARWILEMGQFIEDREITEYEKKLLEQLKNVKDPLVYLTSRRIMDGVSGWDADWARGWSPKRGEYLYLDEDLVQLEKVGMVQADIRPALKDFVAKGENDFEIRKGLYLIFNYGHPPSNVSRLDFNTQLLMLCYLLHYGIAEGEERLALAAALDYGSVLAISEESLWPRIVEFVRHRLDFISETSEILNTYGTDWNAEEYPLQACIGLLWGSNSQGDRDENILGKYFARRQCTAEEFERIFVQANTMVGFRDWLLEKGLFSKQEDLMRFCRDNAEVGKNYESKVCAAAELAIRLSWQLDVWHPDWNGGDVNWQWYNFKDCGSFFGHCRDSGAIGSFLMRSINIPLLQRSHAYWHYIPKDDVWRSDARELVKLLKTFPLGSPPYKPGHTVYHKIEWDNFHLGFEMGGAGTNDNIVVFYRTTDARLIADGIPGGYVFRKSLDAWWPKDWWKMD